MVNCGVCGFVSAQGIALHRDIEALGECRAYTDSLQNEPFILTHLHIQQYMNIMLPVILIIF